MKYWIWAVLFFYLLGSPSSAQQDYELSFLVVRSRTGEVLRSQEEDKPRTPASTMKLVTAAAALEMLGPDHHYFTQVRASGPTIRGRLRGNLALYGEGYLELTEASLEELASQLQRLGLRAVSGDLIVDDGGSGWPPYGPGWAWDDAGSEYSPEVTGLALNGGVVELTSRTKLPWLVQEPAEENSVLLVPGRSGVLVRGELPDSIAPPNSAVLTGERFVQILARHGIRVRGLVRRGVATGQTLAEHRSRPLQQLLTEAMATSDNLAMELIHRSTGEKLPRSLEGQKLRRVDGSGLSRYNLLSASQLVAVLRGTSGLKEVLPGSGQGTLKKRFLEGAAAGNIKAKTGSLGNVSGLAGYLFPGTPEELTFAILINGHLGSGAERKRLEDELVESWVQDFARR